MILSFDEIRSRVREAMKKEAEKIRLIRLIRLMGTSIFPEPDDAEKSCTLKSDLLPVWCDHQGGNISAPVYKSAAQKESESHRV